MFSDSCLAITCRHIQHFNTRLMHLYYFKLRCSYRMAESAVKQAIPKLHALGVPTKRPEDYFAQMIKSDDHMRKVSTATSELSSTTL